MGWPSGIVRPGSVGIEKDAPRKGPLGIAALESKIVQRAATEGLNAIYEVDFLSFFYGFLSGKRCVALANECAAIKSRTGFHWWPKIVVPK